MKSKKTKWEGLRGRRGSENQIEWKRGSGKENDACVKFKRKKKKFDARKRKKNSIHRVIRLEPVKGSPFLFILYAKP